MKQFITFVIKESKHIIRDKRTMLVLFGMPIMLMLIFGYAIRNDVKDVRTILVAPTPDHAMQQFIEQLNASPYFDIVAALPTPTMAEKMIRAQKADIAIVFSSAYAAGRTKGTAAMQIITDAADPNMAQQYQNYISQIALTAFAPKAIAHQPFTKLLYNPQMLSAYNFVPGIMGMLLLLICTMMTSVSIVKEKEKGTMEVLLVSPVRPLLVIIAKAVPYFVISLGILIVILLMAYFLLDVPFAGGIAPIILVSLLYILLGLALGLFVSNIATSQLMALLLSAMVFLLPTVMLSGMLFPIESMPAILRALSAVVPARWYIAAMRKLMIMGVGLGYVWKELLVLAGMTAFLLIVSLKKFKTRLE